MEDDAHMAECLILLKFLGNVRYRTEGRQTDIGCIGSGLFRLLYVMGVYPNVIIEVNKVFSG